MERTWHRVRQIRMTDHRLLRTGPGIPALAGAALLAAALATTLATTLAGCASATSSAAAATAATAAAPQVGCASVNQATAVSIQQTMRAVDPTMDRTGGTVYRQSPAVRALFGQLCAAVTHPATATTVMHCPLDIGATYYGTFYDGSRSLATFSYAASGCQRVSVSAAGKTMDTMVISRAAAAAPHLSTDLDALVGTKPGLLQPQGTASSASASPGTASPGPVNPGGTMDPAP